MDVSVIITCWNGKRLLEKNLPLVIKAENNPQNKIKEIIVVDDSSTDDSVVFLKSNFPQVKMAVHGKNIGYSATCNTGVDLASSELVAILNLDVIPEKDFLVAALPNFKDEKVFAVSFNEGKLGPGKIEWKKGFLEIKPSIINEDTELADWASGGSSIFRKSIWEEIGGMDKFFLPFYFEDIDLGLRAKKRGYKCLWEPMAKVEHVHEATINKENFKEDYINSIKQRNHLLLTWRNIDSFGLFLSHIVNLFKRCVFHPGYFKIVFLAAKRLIIFNLQNKNEKN